MSNLNKLSLYVHVLCILQLVVKKKSLPDWKPVSVFLFLSQISFCCRLVYLKKVVSETNHKNLVRFFVAVEDVNDWEVNFCVPSLCIRLPRIKLELFLVSPLHIGPF